MYQVTLAGFNYVDDSCSQYFDRLFKLNRQRDAAKSALSVFGQTTDAILFATGASKLTMAIVAQAFGLASSLTDITAGTYLYQLPPAPTKRFVETLMVAYKDGVASQRTKITSPAVAYSYIRGYLNLCLPATIEGELINHVSSATAVADPGMTGASLRVKVASDRGDEVAALEEIARVGSRLPAANLPPPSPYADLVTPPEWKRIQNYLCLKPDGKWGPDTRAAIAQFYAGREETKPSDNEKVVRLLIELADQTGGKSCEQRNVSDAKVVGQLSK
ncbi:MAG: hypothetical protein WDZ83_00385 [Rhizobiaceae bacterium]